MILVDVSHQQQVNDTGIFPLGIIIDDVGLFQVAQPGQDAFNNLNRAMRGLEKVHDNARDPPSNFSRCGPLR
jgi:hypothetical protein